MKNSNRKKNEQLGMTHGKAGGILRKNIMFLLVQKLGLDFCYQCKNKINSVDEFSIEHKIPWQTSDNPIKFFFDLENISFSHLKCNCESVKITKEIAEAWGRARFIKSEEGYSYCTRCKTHKPTSEFHKNKFTVRGYSKECRSCRQVIRAKK